MPNCLESRHLVFGAGGKGMKHILEASLVMTLAALLATTGCTKEEAPLEVGDPGRVTMHRLNKAEYNNTVRDLLGTELTPADDFPGDDHGHGFDNIADALSMSPLHVELYHRAAELLSDDLLRIPPTALVQGEALEAPTGSLYRGSGWSIWDATPLPIELDARADGSYRLSLRAFGIAQLDEAPQIRISSNGTELATLTISATSDAPVIYETNL